MSGRIHVGVIGASGYAGAELLRLCASHPSFEVVFAAASSHTGENVSGLYPSLALAYPDLVFGSADESPGGLDVVFLALPHGLSQGLVEGLDAGLIVDLGADFRFDDLGVYESWYGKTHGAPDLTSGFAYGLVELFRDEIVVTKSVAVPGCYPTAATLTIAPLLQRGLVEPTGIVVNAISGVSGAGRDPKPSTTYGTVSENLTAYGLLSHRHTPEMEMGLSRVTDAPVDVIFTPHLAPMNRGILATCYLRPSGEESTEELLEAMASAYKTEVFVEVDERIPSTKATHGSNSIHMTVRRDYRTGWVIAVGALDNLGKGAAGQAIQCANLMLGLDEAAGLSIAGVYP